MPSAAIAIATRQDRFGNSRDPLVGYARGTIISNEVAESLRQQRAYQIIRDRYATLGDAGLFNLTGLIRAFPFAAGDEESMRSYVHFIARSRGELEAVALGRLGGQAGVHDGFLANRVSAAMIAIMLVLLDEGATVLSLVAADRSHPSVKQAVNLARGSFQEVIGIQAFEEALQQGTTPRVVVITTISPSKHHLPAADVAKATALARSHGAKVVLDDAHMASRIAIYDEPPSLALDPGPDLSVWSLDKHMSGPRSGFVSGKSDLVRKVKARALALGVEAQTGQYLAGLHAVESFDPAPIKSAARLAERVFATLGGAMSGRGYLAGAGIAVGGEDFLEMVLLRVGRQRTSVVPIEAVAFASMTVLEQFGAVTIPAVGMPGAACTFRLMMHPDGERFGEHSFAKAWQAALDATCEALDQPDRIRAVLFGLGVARPSSAAAISR
jgi:L-seryl-tRNA(Ser) seleniumtransferase